MTYFFSDIEAVLYDDLGPLVEVVLFLRVLRVACCLFGLRVTVLFKPSCLPGETMVDFPLLQV